MNTLLVYNQVALAMAYCNGATKETATEMANNMALNDVITCTNVIASVVREMEGENNDEEADNTREV